MARLNTTTYQSRHTQNLSTLASFVKEDAKTVLEIGPGGVLRMFAPYMRRNIFGRLLKAIEKPLRRIAFLPLESFEPFEILESLKASQPHLTVVDIHDRTLNGIQAKNAGRYPISTRIHDIAQAPFPEQSFDVVVCNAVINWPSQDYKTMIDNVVASTKVGGYMLLTTNFQSYIDAKSNLKQVARDIYQRIA
ncbi:MAG: hypothetical protein KU37_08615 [Sulfuricurvum sp. PC08-66]|nr:MAG: hypothetical protein KU37_08615 [Sulfuricurvum sp. PC08-66]